MFAAQTSMTLPRASLVSQEELLSNQPSPLAVCEKRLWESWILETGYR